MITGQSYSCKLCLTTCGSSPRHPYVMLWDMFERFVNYQRPCWMWTPDFTLDFTYLAMQSSLLLDVLSYPIQTYTIQDDLISTIGIFGKFLYNSSILDEVVFSYSRHPPMSLELRSKCLLTQANLQYFSSQDFSLVLSADEICGLIVVLPP